MKFLFLIILALTSSATMASQFSLGGVLGTPTGLSLKYNLTDKNAIQTDLSGGYSALDYIWYSPYKFEARELKWFYGGGVIIKKSVGARAVSGLEYKLNQYPVHLGANLSFNIVNDDDFKQSFGVAALARYEF